MAGISALDMANLRLAFAKLDTNGDGTLTKEEMRAGARELGISISDLEALFDRMDNDGSGEIDYTEFADSYADFSASKLRHTFEKLDVDGNGTLSLEEMRAGIDELGIDEKDLEPLFRKMDSDKSGEVDYAEFANKLLLEMAGGWVGKAAGHPGKAAEETRFAGLGSRALQVYVLSLEDLPHREDDGTDWKPEVFAVRVRWPSAPFFGETELPGLAAYVWGTPRRRPGSTHGAYVYVDQTARLPWVGGQASAVLSVHRTDLLEEELVGEVELPLVLGREVRVRRFPIRGPRGTVEGFAHLSVTLPLRHERDANNLFSEAAAGRPIKPPPRRRRMPSTQAAWWSPLWLCSSTELRYAESC